MYGGSLMFWRWWVRIPAPYIGFFTVKIVMFVWKYENNEKEDGDGPFLIKMLKYVANTREPLIRIWQLGRPGFESIDRPILLNIYILFVENAKRKRGRTWPILKRTFNCNLPNSRTCLKYAYRNINYYHTLLIRQGVNCNINV